MKAKTDSVSVVYFAQVGKHIKIGVTRKLDERLKAFSTSVYDVKLLLALPGDRTLERQLHELLAEDRVARELFQFSWRINGFIEYVECDGLDHGLQWLMDTTSAGRKKKKEAERAAKVQAARLTKAQEMAYFASLVADRKRRLGW